MTSRLAAAALILTTGATVFAADDQWTPADTRHAHEIAREVRQAVRESLREVRHDVRTAVREAVHVAHHITRDVLTGYGVQVGWEAERAAERAARAARRAARAAERAADRAAERAERAATRGSRDAARDQRDRERDERRFRQISPTDDPCTENRGDRRGWACEVRDTRMAAPGSALTVDASPNGGIRVEAWDEPGVLVRAIVQAHAESDGDARALLPQVHVRADGGRVSAEGPSERGRGSDGWREGGWSVSFRIWAPRQVALELSAKNGGISIHGMQGQARFSTVNGGVTLDDVGGDVSGTTRNGGVTVRLAGQRWNGAGLDVETTNGGVSLSLPRDYSAALELSTMNGGIRSELPVTLDGDRRREVRTTLGSGGPLLKVRTVNGGVRLAAR